MFLRLLWFAVPLALCAYAFIAYGFFPAGATVHPDMRAVFAAHPVGIHVHVFASIAALAIGPWQFSERFRRSRPGTHRVLGRLYLGVGVMGGGTSGLYMAQFALGGIASSLGFALLALAWLGTGGVALVAILRRDVPRHRAWMVRNYALTLAAVTIRAYLPIGRWVGVPFETWYSVTTWACWIPNLVFAEWWIRSRTRARSALL